MPAPIRAVVFDLDGLMFDTEALFFLLLTRTRSHPGRQL